MKLYINDNDSEMIPGKRSCVKIQISDLECCYHFLDALTFWTGFLSRVKGHQQWPEYNTDDQITDHYIADWTNTIQVAKLLVDSWKCKPKFEPKFGSICQFFWRSTNLTVLILSNAVQVTLC